MTFKERCEMAYLNDRNEPYWTHIIVDAILTVVVVGVLYYFIWGV